MSYWVFEKIGYVGSRGGFVNSREKSDFVVYKQANSLLGFDTEKLEAVIKKDGKWFPLVVGGNSYNTSDYQNPGDRGKQIIEKIEYQCEVLKKKYIVSKITSQAFGSPPSYDTNVEEEEL